MSLELKIGEKAKPAVWRDTTVIKCRFYVNKYIVDNSLMGSVQIVSDRMLAIQHAYAEIVGYASCSWLLDKTQFKMLRMYPKGTNFRGSEQFYYTRHTLCGGEDVHDHLGIQSYDFKCYWPTRLPGTWSGDYGSVEYIGKATIRLENDDRIYVHSQPLIVKFRRPLELEPHLMFEGQMQVERTFFTTKSVGNVQVSVWLPICGIAAGQSLPVTCTIINKSRLHFGGLVFVLTRIDIYKSDKPTVAVRKVRTDVCRVGRMVDIHKGKFEYYAVLRTGQECVPTNQFHQMTCCQVVYEVWVSVRGAFKRYRHFGYPNIDTPGIPVVIGTRPLKSFDTNEITVEIFKKMYESNVPLLIDELPEDVQQIIHKTDEELSPQAMENLQRQLEENEKLTNTLMKKESVKSVVSIA